MRTDEKIARLEGLLERVRRNASVPRERFSTIDVEEGELVPPDGAAMAEAETSVVEIDEPIAAVEVGDVEEIDVEELDLTDEEIVDLTDAEELAREPELEHEPVPAVAAAAESLDWEEEVEEPPVSSQRPIAATSMDEALAGAAEHVEMEEGREIPLKTPPPESGPQAAPLPPLGSPAVPVLEEADIASAQPAVQGEALLELDEPTTGVIEVEEPEVVPPPAPESGEIVPQVVERSAIPAASPSAYLSAVRGHAPVTFVELLDASLGLRPD